MSERATRPHDGPGHRAALVVDARALWRSGIGRYTREIAARLARRGAFRDVLLVGDEAELRDWCEREALPDTVRIQQLAGGRYSLASQIGWARLSAALPRDAVVWFPHWDVPLLYAGPPSVVTVHDLIHLRVPGVASSRTRLAVRVLLRVATRRAARIVTDAEFTRDDLLVSEPGLAGRIDVVSCGVSTRFLQPPAPDEALPPGMRAPFLLAVGNRKPHKNLLAAVEVLAMLRLDDPSLVLVVAGERFPEWDDVMLRAAALGVATAIIDPSSVSDAQLAALYRGCECLLFPSRYEGFGLPVLEAMACGAPVVASNATSIPEVAGDAALLSDPDDHASMASDVRRVRADAGLRTDLSARGIARAAGFTWDRAAEQIETVLLSAAAKSE